MKINKKIKPTKSIIFILLILLLVGSGAVCYAYKLWPFNPKANTTQSSSQKKDSTLDNNSSTKKSIPSPNSNKNVDTTKTTNEIPQNQGLSLTITDLSQNTQSIVYSATLNDSNQNGSCVAEFTIPGAKPVTSTTSANNGVCGPVNIPSESFTEIGKWTLTLHYYINNTQVDAVKTIDIH